MTTFASGYDWVVSPHARRDHAGHAAADLDASASRARGRRPGPRSASTRSSTRPAAARTSSPAARPAGAAAASPDGSTSTRRRSSQDFDWIKGSHSLSFGGVWTRPHTDGDGTFAVQRHVGLQRPDYQRHHQRQRRPEHGRLRARAAGDLQSGAAASRTIRSINAIGLYFGDVWRAEPQADAELRHPVGAVSRRQGQQRVPARPSAARTSTRASGAWSIPTPRSA